MKDQRITIGVTHFVPSEVVRNFDLLRDIEAIDRKIFNTERSFRHDVLPRSTDVYIATCDRAMAGYLFIERGTLSVAGHDVPAIHLGPVATAPAYRREGVQRNLLAAMISNEVEKRRRTVIDPILWALTASPISYLSTASQFIDLEPTRDGGYSERGLEAAEAIRGRFSRVGMRSIMAHPFLLPGVVPDRCYLPDVAEELLTVRAASGPEVFDLLGVDQAKGDRMIMVFRLPNV